MLIIFSYMLLGAGLAGRRRRVLVFYHMDDGRIHAYMRLSFIFKAVCKDIVICRKK